MSVIKNKNLFALKYLIDLIYSDAKIIYLLDISKTDIDV